jgi:hypothetical protein
VRELDGETILSHNGAVSGFHAFNTIVPRSRSAVVLLTNSEHLNPGTIHSTILRLLIKDQKTSVPTTNVPKVHGPAPDEAALEFFHEMQAGKLDREKLGEEFRLFLSDDRLKAAAPRLKALGEPEKVEVEHVNERGGMEVASIVLTFKSAQLHGLLYRTPDGRIQQLLFRRR